MGAGSPVPASGSSAATAQLENLAAPLRKQGLTVSVDVVWDHPFDAAIVKKAAAHDYWLVAKDTHHHNLVQRTLLTNVDWHLIRKCPAPLLLVKDRKLAAEPNVLAAVDPVNQHDKPAALDDGIFTFAADLARVLRGHLHVVHSYATPLGAELPPDVLKIIMEEHRAAMTKFLDTHATLGGRKHLYEGAAHECLQQAAKEHEADFVVMGAVARRGFQRLVIGSTAERVLDRLPCDLDHHQATRIRGDRCRLADSGFLVTSGSQRRVRCVARRECRAVRRCHACGLQR